MADVMSLSLTNMREMMAFINEEVQNETLILSKVFKQKIGHNISNTVDYTLTDRNTTVASFTPVNAREPKEAGRANPTARSFTIPRSWEAVTIDVNELNNVNAIGNIYGSVESQKKAQADYVANILTGLQDRKMMLWELCGAMALTKGKIEATKEMLNSDHDFVFDFEFDNGNYVKVKSKWNTEDAKIITDIRKAKTMIRQNTGLNADLILMGSKASEVFIENTLVAKQLDSQRANPGGIDLTNQGSMISPNFLGCEVYEYDQLYTTANGASKSIFPEDAVVVVASKSKGNIMHRGVIQRINSKARSNNTFIDDFYVNTLVNPYDTVMSVECEARQIPMLHQPKAVVNITNIL